MTVIAENATIFTTDASPEDIARARARGETVVVLAPMFAVTFDNIVKCSRCGDIPDGCAHYPHSRKATS